MSTPESKSTSTLGAIAAGHPATAEAAAFALREGGNAFDAVVAAHWCACIAEPVLTSLGGGGFLLAQAADHPACVYDFFTHTPQGKRPPAEIDFYPIQADFGTTQQEFHIGYGSVAAPGTVRGLFAIQRELCRLPMSVLMAPAIDLARTGIRVNELQAYIFDVVKPIYLATGEAARLYASRTHADRLVAAGEILVQSALADTLEALSREGDRLFYEGDIAAAIDSVCRTEGGYLRRRDLQNYRVIKRQPLAIRYRNAQLLTNPPPSSGGLLIGFALKLMQNLAADGFDYDQPDSIVDLATIMQCTNEARLESLRENSFGQSLLDPELLAHYFQRVRGRKPAYRGTTHISVIDREGNLAALTTSNGEGCGHMLADTGIMLNNMLGEEDLNPYGFQRWEADQRLTSMMAPSALRADNGKLYALGSGGSNRIRSAILQVVSGIIDAQLNIEQAIHRPRIHYENDQLNVEPGFTEATVSLLREQYSQFRSWPDLNLFFGGVHAVAAHRSEFECCGDPRRGGVALKV